MDGKRMKRLAVFAVLASSAEAQGGVNVLLDAEFWRLATVEDVRAALAGGADVHARDEVFGMTPLHWAAQVSKTPGVVEALLAGGADVNARSDGGGTPLHWAARFSEVPGVVKALLAAGADVNTRDEHGFTPLYLAAGGARCRVW